MYKHLKMTFLLALLIGAAGEVPLWSQAGFGEYLRPAEIDARLGELQKKHSSVVKLKQLATSPGGSPVRMLEISSGSDRPAILVVANVEGTYPLASLGALYLAEQVLAEPSRYHDLNWFIVPGMNPDGALRYFTPPLFMDGRNALKVNDDLDELADEDGYNDLNGDGLITRIRVKDPAGEWIPVEGEARLMKKADPQKGEKGIYKLYTEGLDDDGDGQYNEDLTGGVDPSINFPHLFRPFTSIAGQWAGSTPETYSLMKFVFEHPEIAMTFSFGSTNFCLNPPRGGRRGSADLDRIKIPERQAQMFNADPDRTYSMKEIMEMVQPMLPQGMEITESMISSFLGLGAVVNPMEADLKFYKTLADKYKEYLKEKGFAEERLDPPQDRDGSFELWAYYHLGVPSFSMNLFTLPKVKEEKKEGDALSPEKLESMSKDDFVALGEEKINAFLKEMGAPPQYSGTMVIQMVQSGQLTPKQIAGMMKQMGGGTKSAEGADPDEKALLAFSDKQLQGKGFVPWKVFTHPDLGEVEIGGEVPFTSNTPPPAMIDSLLSIQVPWVIELAGHLPRLSLLKVETKDLGEGIHRIEVWVQNDRLLPFPTAMGERNERPAPAILFLEGEGLEFLTGLSRMPLQSVGGHQAKKIEWMVRSAKPQTLTVRLTSKQAWGDVKTIKIGG